MPTSKANSTWKGDLKNGKGVMKFESGSYEGEYTFASRFKNGKGTNPEELIGAAHSGCYAMALSNELAGAGYEPQTVDAKAEVTFKVTEDGPAITGIKLIVEADVPQIENETFQKFAAGAKEGCPVSKALTGTEISIQASLK